MTAEHRALLVIVLVAAGLRAWGIDHGLPAIGHDDEWQYCAAGAACLEYGRLTVETDDGLPYRNPTGYSFLVALAELPVDAYHAGGLPGGVGTRARYRAHRGDYHLAGRWVSLLAALGAVVATWALGRTWLGARPALLAAALLAVSPLHVRDAQFAVNDVTAGALLLCALMAWRLRLDLRGAIWAGLLLGYAVGTKYSAGLLLPALALDVLLRSAPAEERLRRVLWLGCGVAGGFLLASPAVLLDSERFWASFREQASYAAAPWPGQDPGPSWRLHTETLLRALGPLGLPLGLLGLVAAARRSRVGEAGYAALHLLVFLPMPMFFIRLDLPLLPFLALGAGAALATCGLRGRVAWGLAALALLLPPTLGSARIASLMARPDTRVELREWLQGQLGPAPLTVAGDIGALRFFPLDARGVFDPRLRPLRVETSLIGFRPSEAIEELRGQGARYLVLTHSYALHVPELAALEEALLAEGALVLEIEPARPGSAVGFDQSERYAPWDYADIRRAPGPRVRVFDLRSGE